MKIISTCSDSRPISVTVCQTEHELVTCIGTNKERSVVLQLIADVSIYCVAQKLICLLKGLYNDTRDEPHLLELCY